MQATRESAVRVLGACPTEARINMTMTHGSILNKALASWQFGSSLWPSMRGACTSAIWAFVHALQRIGPGHKHEPVHDHAQLRSEPSSMP
eukprot:349632-Chlamydomonas_euryale.AAC.13